jgi:serine/threonine protein kinase
MTIGTQEWAGLTLAGGRYKVTAKLGEGGMGFVYRALDQNIDSDVVIKVPRQSMMDDPEFVGRFTREIRSLVKLSHPHIVKVTDVGNFDGIPFAVMQYLAGGSLEDQRPVGPAGQALPCDPRNVPRWLLAVAEALDYIHTQGYVHRDVKPGNILFDTQGHAFLSDFGVAKVMASAKNPAPSQTAMTGAGMVLGTPEYMAPELIMGDPFDGRVDQYALAITVYELLCGRRPFEDETKTRVLVLHTSMPPSPLTTWCQTLPVPLSQAVLKGLAKEPAQRYASCVALARAVAAAAESVVVPDERIRLKCSSCGKTGSIPVADLARLKAAGGRATCPACKSPIDIGNAVQVAPGPTTGGTMKFAVSGAAGDYRAATGQSPTAGGTAGLPSVGGSSGGHKGPQPPQPERGGTMAMSAPDRPVPPPIPGQGNPPPRSGSGTIIERTLPRPDEAAPPRRGSGTIIERTLPRPNEAAASDFFNTLDSAAPLGSGSPKGEQPGESQQRGADQTRIWIALGAAAAAGLLTAVGTAFFMSGSSKDSGSPPSATRTAQTDPQPPTKSRTPEDSSPPPHTEINKTRLANGSMPSRTSGSAPNLETARDTQPPEKEASDPSSASPDLASTDQPFPAPDSPAPPRKKAGKAAAKRAPPHAPAGMFATNQFNMARMPKRLRQPEYSAGKNIAKAKSFGEEWVIPAGMYRLKHSNEDNQAGPRKYLVIECSVQEKRGPKGVVLELTEHGSSDFEVEPRLATKLDRLPRKILGQSVAILPLWIDSSGNCGIVCAELLEKCEARLKPGYGIGQADVDYHVRFLSPEEDKTGKAPDEEWQRVGRMNHFYTHWKHHVDGLKKRQQTANMAALNATMGNMYASAMRNAAASAAAEGDLQRRLQGR